ncbi:MAG: hypothetical protein AAGB11_20830, partial [Pseudomonadota bacterium]
RRARTTIGKRYRSIVRPWNQEAGQSVMARKTNSNKKPVKTLIANDPEKLKGALTSIGGSDSNNWNKTITDQAHQTVRVKYSDTQERDRQYGAAVSALASIAPKNELESVAVAQITASHNAVMECFRRAMMADKSFERRREALNQANNLSCTWAALLDTLNKHRGKGQQKVTVEHVHVQDGGQALVRNVDEQGRDHNKVGEQPHAKDITDTSQSSMWRENPKREAVPFAFDGERSLQDARRNLPGGAEGQ